MSRVCALALLGLVASSPGCKRTPTTEASITFEPIAPPPSASVVPTEVAGKYRKPSKKRVLLGEAAYYSDALAGRPTASGEPYAPEKLTAAHRTLPLGSLILVTRVDDGKSVQVRVNDRGPYGKKGRIVDLSRAAAERLGMQKSGIAQVRVEVVGHHKP
jgi:rare lipoprotein A